MENSIKTRDALSRAYDLTERADLLITEIIDKYLVRAENGRRVMQIDAHNACLKAEMIQETIVGIMAVIEELEETATPQREPMKDHRHMTDEERVKEINGDIEKAVELIAQRPDWLDALKHLNTIAWALAMGRAAKVEIDLGEDEG